MLPEDAYTGVSLYIAIFIIPQEYPYNSMVSHLFRRGTMLAIANPLD
jgi:hypothetical protein